MSATTLHAPERIQSTDQRRLSLVAVSAVAVVAGLAVWFFAHMIGHDGENTGTMVGILVASIGLTFLFPALKTHLLARRWV